MLYLNFRRRLAMLPTAIAAAIGTPTQSFLAKIGQFAGGIGFMTPKGLPAAKKLMVSAMQDSAL